jgi:hypothetical protein
MPIDPLPRPADLPSALYCTDLGLGLLSFVGADAESFLQGQLSNDLKALQPGELQLSGYSSPKGRLLATLLVWREGADGFRALVAGELAEALRKRLAMYVLRAKVTVADLSPQRAILGMGGAHADDAVRAATGVVPEAGRVARTDNMTVAALPDGRYVLVAPAERAESLQSAAAAAATRVPRRPGHRRRDAGPIRAADRQS